MCFNARRPVFNIVHSLIVYTGGNWIAKISFSFDGQLLSYLQLWFPRFQRLDVVGKWNFLSIANFVVSILEHFIVTPELDISISLEFTFPCVHRMPLGSVKLVGFRMHIWLNIWCCLIFILGYTLSIIVKFAALSINFGSLYQSQSHLFPCHDHLKIFWSLGEWLIIRLSFQAWNHHDGRNCLYLVKIFTSEDVCSTPSSVKNVSY